MLKIIDGFLLRSTQKFCDNLQDLTGLTKFRVEKWAMVAETLFYCFFLGIEIDAFRSVLVLITVANCYFSVGVIEEQEAEFLHNGTLRPKITHSQEARILALLVVGVCGAVVFAEDYGWMFVVAILLFVAWVYSSACIPRPPGKSKMREWSEKALAWLNGRLPDPAPA